MKKLYIYTTLLLAGLPALPIDNQFLQGVSFFSPRSQSTDAVRETIGTYPYTHRFDYNAWYGNINGTLEYRRSFHADHIAEALFGTDMLFVSGSQVIGRGENDILADYFGLSTEFASTVELSPTIQNVIFTFGGYLGFEGLPKFYIELYAPVVWTRWNFAMNETVFNTGIDTPFPAHYMDVDPVTAPIEQFSDAFTGNVTFGQMTDPLRYGKICGPQTQGGFSDIHINIGYDVVSTENGYVSLSLRLAAPTGTRPDSEFFFEPLIGNGKHWEIGVGIDGRILVWEKDGYQELSMFAQLNMMHLLNGRQRRSFDFCLNSFNGFGSRFELLKEFNEDGVYINKLVPALNVTTLCCDVSADLQVEFLFMLGYTHKGLEFDVGYNAWMRSKEKIKLRECIDENRYGLKGIQNVANLSGGPSELTQSTATLHGNFFDDQSLVADDPSPVFISTSDLNIGSAASPFVLTNKLFTYLGYGWHDSDKSDRYIPFVGGGLSVEFEGINSANTEKPNRNTLSQWAFFIKGGIAFS